MKQFDYVIVGAGTAGCVLANRLSAETGISVSEDPSFRFFLKPHSSGELTAEISDSKGNSWRETIPLAPS